MNKDSFAITTPTKSPPRTTIANFDLFFPDMSSDDEPVSTPETSKGSKRVKEEIAAASTSKKRREEDDGDRRWVSDDDGQESGDDEEYEDVEDSDNEESPLLSLDQWKVQELKILDDEMMKAKWPMVKSNADKWHILRNRIYNATEILSDIDENDDVEAVPPTRSPEYANAIQKITKIMDARKTKGMQGDKGQCWECDSEFRNLAEFIKHFRHMHLNDSAFKCKICSQGFQRKGEASKHILATHMLNHAFKCEGKDGCGKTFRFQQGLNEHIRYGHITTDGYVFTLEDGEMVYRKEKASDKKSLQQLYGWLWKKNKKRVGKSVSFTSRGNVSGACSIIHRQIRKVRPKKIKLRNLACSCRHKYHQDGWRFNPKKAFSFKIYANSRFVITQLKWWLRIKLDSVRTLATLESLEYFKEHEETLYKIIQPLLSKVSVNMEYVEADPEFEADQEYENLEIDENEGDVEEFSSQDSEQ